MTFDSGKWAESAAEDALVALIAAIGTPHFGRAVMAAVAAGAQADMCSAFVLGAEGPEVVIAESTSADRSPFARIASLRYARQHWRRDLETLFNLGRANRSAVLARRSASSIRDVDYRHECYGAGDVGERLSACRGGALPVIVNVYRDAARPRFSTAAATWVETRAPMLIASVERHRTLSLERGHAAGIDVPDLMRRLDALGHGLSQREAEVLARTALGETRETTATELGLSVTSVATYRRRGYAKLGIRTRAEIQPRLGPSGKRPADRPLAHQDD